MQKTTASEQGVLDADGVENIGKPGGTPERVREDTCHDENEGCGVWTLGELRLWGSFSFQQRFAASKTDF